MATKTKPYNPYIDYRHVTLTRADVEKLVRAIGQLSCQLPESHSIRIIKEMHEVLEDVDARLTPKKSVIPSEP